MREGMKESTCSLLSAPVLQCVSQKPTAEIANVPRMKKAEGRGEVCGNCLSLPQSGIALETISLLLRPSLSLSLSLLQESLSTRVSNFICGGGDRARQR